MKNPREGFDLKREKKQSALYRVFLNQGVSDKWAWIRIYLRNAINLNLKIVGKVKKHGM